MEGLMLDGPEFFIPAYSSVCSFCNHLKDYGEGRICAAFPEGIPMEIWMGGNKHLTPFSGQENDIVFEEE